MKVRNSASRREKWGRGFHSSPTCEGGREANAGGMGVALFKKKKRRVNTLLFESLLQADSG